MESKVLVAKKKLQRGYFKCLKNCFLEKSVNRRTNETSICLDSKRKNACHVEPFFHLHKTSVNIILM